MSDEIATQVQHPCLKRTREKVLRVKIHYDLEAMSADQVGGLFSREFSKKQTVHAI